MAMQISMEGKAGTETPTKLAIELSRVADLKALVAAVSECYRESVGEIETVNLRPDWSGDMLLQAQREGAHSAGTKSLRHLVQEVSILGHMEQVTARQTSPIATRERAVE